MLALERGGHEEFVVRFQQTTGSVMAKGVEDTAFYRYLRLTALNEVGADPGRFSLPVDEFHRANVRRAARFPRQMARCSLRRHMTQSAAVTCAPGSRRWRNARLNGRSL